MTIIARDRRLRRRCATSRGETLVEFALTMLVFFMTLLGSFQFGLATWQFNMVSNLAQEGARWAAVRGAGSGAIKASESDVQTFVRARAAGLSPNVSTYSVNSGTKVCTSTHTNPSTLSAGTPFCVKVQKTFAPLTRIVPMATITLSSTAQMIIAR